MEQEKSNKTSNRLMIKQDNYMKEFRMNVETFARENNLTLKKVSELSDLSFATLNSFLYGNTRDCKLSTAIKLAKSFGISIDELVGAGTVSESVEKTIKTISKLHKRTRYMIGWMIRYYEKLLEQDGRDKIISVMLPNYNVKGDYVYSGIYTKLDITFCDKDVRSKVFMGIKIINEDYMPKYMPGDTLLLANDRGAMPYEDCVIVYYGKIYIVKRKCLNGENVYCGIKNHLFCISEEDIDLKIGYVAEVVYEKEK